VESVKMKEQNLPNTILPLATIVFPGRNVLMIHEVAKALNCTNQHVIDLIVEGQIVAVDIGGPAEVIANKTASSKTARRCLRIPVASYDNFLRCRTL
jgi:hypothetical protein